MQEGSSSGPTHLLEEKIGILMAQFSQLVQLLMPHESNQPSTEAVKEQFGDPNLKATAVGKLKTM